MIPFIVPNIPARHLAAFLPLISVDETRLVINGLCVEHTPGEGVRFVATDGRRLACYQSTHAPVSHGDVGQWIVPRNLIELLSLMVDETAVDLQVADGQVLLTVPSLSPLTLAAPLLAGSFPRWREVLPDSLPTTFDIGNDKLNHAYLASITGLAEGLEIGAACTIAARPNEPVILQARQGERSLVAALMPMRIR